LWRPRHPEVSDQHVALGGEQDVLGLDVAVHHAVAVGVVEGGGRLAADAHRLVDRKLALSTEPIPE
jgi:hypothetical protein